ncbi:unnamed protein product [Paramecium octaurelia]|uniref:Uncharacterized protein n=1 Tax=Paramecium octaurelia TaxID=43137 RepID=A0A8S1WCK0_PAROT|nr:unnamed protein product [Paramecium octaurelia]
MISIQHPIKQWTDYCFQMKANIYKILEFGVNQLLHYQFHCLLAVFNKYEMKRVELNFKSNSHIFYEENYFLIKGQDMIMIQN